MAFVSTYDDLFKVLSMDLFLNDVLIYGVDCSTTKRVRDLLPKYSPVYDIYPLDGNLFEDWVGDWSLRYSPVYGIHRLNSESFEDSSLRDLPVHGIHRLNSELFEDLSFRDSPVYGIHC